MLVIYHSHSVLSFSVVLLFFFCNILSEPQMKTRRTEKNVFARRMEAKKRRGANGIDKLQV